MIGLMFAVGLAMGGYAWWAQFQKGRHVLEFWGPRSANLIRHASRVEVLLLADPSAANASEPDPAEPNTPAGDAARAAEPEFLTVAGQRRLVVQRRDISQVHGLVHARHALVVDDSYDWQQPRGDCVADWEFALRFQQQKEQATLVFDQACARVRLLEQDRETALLRPLSDLIGQRHRKWAAEGVAP